MQNLRWRNLESANGIFWKFFYDAPFLRNCCLETFGIVSERVFDGNQIGRPFFVMRVVVNHIRVKRETAEIRHRMGITVERSGIVRTTRPK